MEVFGHLPFWGGKDIKTWDRAQLLQSNLFLFFFLLLFPFLSTHSEISITWDDIGKIFAPSTLPFWISPSYHPTVSSLPSIVGLELPKRTLQEIVILPALRPEVCLHPLIPPDKLQSELWSLLLFSCSLVSGLQPKDCFSLDLQEMGKPCWYAVGSLLLKAPLVCACFWGLVMVITTLWCGV